MKIFLKDLLDEFQEWVSEKRVKRIPYEDWRGLAQYKNHFVEIKIIGWARVGLFDLTDQAPLAPVGGWNINDGSFGEFLDEIYDREYDRDDSKTMEELSYALSNTSALTVSLSAATNKLKDSISQFTINRKEDNNMNNLFKGFEFGSCENDNVKMSMYGIAVKNANNTWVSYDTNSGNVIDVDILNFNAKYLYKMPAAIKDIKIGDTIIHNRKPVFVTKIEGGKVLAIDPAAGEEKIILLARSPFGFDFVTKVINFFEGYFDNASIDNPFGNILPLMLINDNETSFKDLLPLLMLNGNGNNFTQNPMMLYFLLGDKANTKDDLLPLLFLNSGNFGIANKTNIEK